MPIRLPITRWSLVSGTKLAESPASATPLARLPEIRLRASGAMPPTELPMLPVMKTPFSFPSARVPETSLPRKLPVTTPTDELMVIPLPPKRLMTSPWTVITLPSSVTNPDLPLPAFVPSSSIRMTALVPRVRVLGRAPGWEYPSTVTSERAGSWEVGWIDHQLCASRGRCRGCSRHWPPSSRR